MEMLGREDEKPLSGVPRKPYLRSISWTDRSPTKPMPRPQPGSKGRSGLPPLSITRRPAEEWPRAGSDDLGVWLNPQTPRGSDKAPELPGVEREFEFKRDKLAFFDKECSRIAEHIYLGSDAVAKNRDTLRQNGITHVLNCVGFVCPEYFKGDLVYKTLWLHDSPSEDITSILYDVFDYFEEVRAQGGRVLVHCYQGVSRSTSLVIAYLMWREGQSFEDAFQFVKTARGVTNPNMGFACQLLQCQKRVHAMPASPNSTLRMYRMAPHSSYDPLHLVPKMLNSPGNKGLDSRGAFIVYIPSAIYIWIGKNCSSVMSNCAGVAANQVIRYERAKGPIITIKEGEEPLEFWEALNDDPVAAAIQKTVGAKKVDEYDLDFELFFKACAGGVVPPFSVSNSDLETCLPARENGWGRLRQKFASGELFSSSKLNLDMKPITDQADMVVDVAEGLEDNVCNNGSSSPVSPSPDPFGSPASIDCSPFSYAGRMKDSYEESAQSISLTDSFLPPSSPCRPPDSFSYYAISSPRFSSKSPTLSPSTPDYASSFTFSPSSSNWSDLSSRQPSPSALEPSASFTDNKPSPLCKQTPASSTQTFSFDHSPRAETTSSPCKMTYPSIAARRGSNPPLMILPSLDKPRQTPKNLKTSWSFSVRGSNDDAMKDVCYSQVKPGDNGEELMLDAATVSVGNEPLSGAEARESVLYHWPTMEKVGMRGCDVLDSISAYMLVAKDGNSCVLYVWLGQRLATENWENDMILSEYINKDGHIHWETIGREFLKRFGFPTDTPLQVVNEGAEPAEFLSHVSCFLVSKC